MKSAVRDKGKDLLLVVGAIFLVMLPYIWKGQDVQVNVWDNLDSNVVWYKMLKDQGKIFAGPEVLVQGFVTETPRFSYPSGWNVELLLVYFFDVFTAYWVNKLLIMLVAFASMYFYLKMEVKEGDIYCAGLGLIWATLAFYPHRGISIAALPMLFVIFSRFRRGLWFKRGLLLVIGYVLYSMFILAGLYIWIIFALIVSYWMLQEKKWNGCLIAGLMLWLLAYVMVDYQLFYAFFFQDSFVTHRDEILYQTSIWTGIRPWEFLIGKDHLGVYYWPGYFWLSMGLVTLFIAQRHRGGENQLPFFACLTLLIAGICSMISMFSWLDLAGDIFSSLHSLNLLRFSFFLPFGIFLVLFIGWSQIQLGAKKWMILFFLGINIFIYQYEWRNLVNNKLEILPYKVPTYGEYFAVQQYKEIKHHLGDRANELIFGHINLPPAVSVYNGLRAADGYLQNYSLNYKHRIRDVIEGELIKDDSLTSHFDNWGNKCYLQNATYPDMFDLYKWKEAEPIRQLNFNFSKLKEDLQVEYLLSSVEIWDQNLELVNLFVNEESAWDIYLYQVKSPQSLVGKHQKL